MIAKLTVAAAAFIVMVGVAAASAAVAYRWGYTDALRVAERVIADRVVVGVEMASAMRQNDASEALRLAEMELDTQTLLLRTARINVGIVTVGTSKPRPAEAIILARRYRALVPPDGPFGDAVRAMVREERDDPAVRSTPRLASLAARLQPAR
jgi:hypothetical protein